MKKRYLLLAMSLTASVGFASFGNTYALQDKKEALTPPPFFDYSYKLQGPDGADPIWHFKNESTGLYSTIYYTRSSASLIGYNYDTGYLNLAGFTDIEWRLQFFQSSASMFLVGDTYFQPWYNSISTNTTTGQSLRKFLFQFSNLSKYDYDIYLDFSSSNSSFVFISYYSGSTTPVFPFTYIYNFATSSSNIQHNSLRLPAFTSIGIFYDTSSGVSFDALYFRKLPLSQGMGGYGLENYNQGVADTELNSVDWFNVIFIEGFGGVLSFIGNYEVLPNLKVFYIIGFTMVLAIVGFVAGQRKKE